MRKKIWALVATLLATPAVACTTCDSGIAQLVREQLFDGRFAVHAAAIGAPLAVLLLLIAVAEHFDGTRR